MRTTNRGQRFEHTFDMLGIHTAVMSSTIDNVLVTKDSQDAAEAMVDSVMEQHGLEMTHTLKSVPAEAPVVAPVVEEVIDVDDLEARLTRLKS